MFKTYTMKIIPKKSLKFLAFIFILGLFITCKKETPNNKIVEPVQSFNLELSEILPMQMTRVISTLILSQDSIVATINGENIVLRKTDEKAYTFLCPVINPGNYNLIIDRKYELPLTIKNYTPIQNPEASFSVFNSELTDFQLNLLKTNLSNKVELANNISYLKNGFNEMNINLNSAEKLKLAYFIESNGLTNSNFSEQFVLNIPDSFMGKNSLFDPNDAADVFILKFTEARVNSIISIGMATAFFLAPTPDFLTKGAAILSSIAAIANISIMFKLIDEDLMQLLSKAVDMEAFQKKAFEINLTNGKKTAIGFKGNFNNFTENDNSIGKFPILFGGISEVNSKVDFFYNCYQKVKNWISGTAPANSNKLLHVGSVVKSKPFFLNPKYLSIKEVSNPNIKVNLSSIGRDVFLNANSTSIKTKTNFTITVKYNQPNLNNSVEKTINATFEPGFDLTGTWNCIDAKIGTKNYFDYTDEWETTCMKTSPPSIIKLIDIIKRDYVRWVFVNDSNIRWEEKGVEIRNSGIDADCKPIINTNQINNNLSGIFLLEGNNLRLKIDNEILDWTFEQTAIDEFKVNNIALSFAFTFKKQ